MALFFLKNKLDFSVARSSYLLMIEAIGKCGTEFPGPCAESTEDYMVGRSEKSQIDMGLKEVEKEWVRTGCTVIEDTWTDIKSRAMVNFVVSSPSRTFFHKSVDVSTYFKNIKSLADLFHSAIEDISHENVVQIIVDGALSYSGLANDILQNYGTIFISPSASHYVNLILEDFCKIDWGIRCIVQAQTITRFIYNSAALLEFMKKFTGGQDTIKPGITTKSVSNILSLQEIFKRNNRVYLVPQDWMIVNSGKQLKNVLLILSHS